MAVGLAVYVALTVATLLVVATITAPYGRHGRRGWGPTVPARWGWLVMESPALVGPVWIMSTVPPGPHRRATWMLLGLWLLHYGYRALVFPWLLRAGSAPMPLVVAVLAFAFNCFNAWVNFTWLAEHGPARVSWESPATWVGLGLFVAGFVGHVRSDAILRSLRAPGETGYRVPHGFLYRWISCPNYASEMVQWTGWALLTSSPAGLMFALYTVANLGPRALAHHRWYRQTFPEYPSQRRALVPFLL